MKTLFTGLLILMLLMGGGLLGWNYYVQRRFRKMAEQKYDLIKPLILKLNAGELPSRGEIAALSLLASLRPIVFDILSMHRLGDLFPAEYNTLEKSAESSLVAWLEFPTELGRAPEAIELMTQVTLPEDGALKYYVFRYLAKPSRWATRNAWMIGVCGPYGDHSKLYDPPLRVYSRFNTTDSITPEEEVRWIHGHIRPETAGS
jgi:hypothetical protein